MTTSFIDNGKKLLLLQQDRSSESPKFIGLEVYEVEQTIALKAKSPVKLNKDEAIQLAAVLLNWVNGKGLVK